LWCSKKSYQAKTHPHLTKIFRWIKPKKSLTLTPFSIFYVTNMWHLILWNKIIILATKGFVKQCWKSFLRPALFQIGLNSFDVFQICLKKREKQKQKKVKKIKGEN
jgi:hypothetical protein